VTTPITRARRENWRIAVAGERDFMAAEVEVILNALDAADAMAEALDDAHDLYTLGRSAANAYHAGDVVAQRQCERQDSELRERLRVALARYRVHVEAK
jgi:hypothetical protein